MKFVVGFAALAALGAGSEAGAVGQIDTVDIQTSSSIQTIGVSGSYSNPNMSGFLNDAPTLSGGSYDATSSETPEEITFKNGSFASGEFARVTSSTRLDIGLKNTDSIVITPDFHSTIVPAGLGILLVEGCGVGDVRFCAEEINSAESFASLLPKAGDVLIAMAAFDFKIMDGTRTAYSIAGSVSLLRNTQTQTNYLVSDLSAAADPMDGLTGFTSVIYPNSPTAFAFAWAATDISFKIDAIAPGGLRTLTYLSTVTSFTRSPRALDGCAGALAYSAFGDPIGRGGSIPPPSDQAPQRDALGPLDPGLCGGGGGSGGYVPPAPVARKFKFAYPTFVNGTLNLALLPPFTGTLPEPGSWALMIGGFGMIGATMRRRRGAIAI